MELSSLKLAAQALAARYWMATLSTVARGSAQGNIEADLPLASGVCRHSAATPGAPTFVALFRETSTLTGSRIRRAGRRLPVPAGPYATSSGEVGQNKSSTCDGACSPSSTRDGP
jgi:hypothetical protein